MHILDQFQRQQIWKRISTWFLLLHDVTLLQQLLQITVWFSKTCCTILGRSGPLCVPFTYNIYLIFLLFSIYIPFFTFIPFLSVYYYLSNLKWHIINMLFSFGDVATFGCFKQNTLSLTCCNNLNLHTYYVYYYLRSNLSV